MGTLTFVVDPAARNPAALQTVISSFMDRSGATRFVTIPGPDRQVFITDSTESSLWTPGNRANFANYDLSQLNGYEQSASGPFTVLINPDSTTGKPPENILAHEVGHLKWPGLGENNIHTPLFYRLLLDSLDDLGIPRNRDIPFGATAAPSSGLPPGQSTLDFNIPRPRCFLAGTPVTMADGSRKPIEEIKVGDRVMAFDELADNGMGKLVPQRVTRTMQGTTTEVIDLRGLRVTPGHRFLSNGGAWVAIEKILKDDGVIVEQRAEGPVQVRARTGAAIGSVEDMRARPLGVLRSGACSTSSEYYCDSASMSCGECSSCRVAFTLGVD